MLRYIELDGKVPKHDFRTFSTDHKNYDDAGVILNKNIIVVDFDDDPDKGLYYSKIGELIYNEYPTLRVHTTRGFHLWYKKPTSDNAKSYLLNLALAGVERIIKNGDLSQSETIDDVTRQYFIQSDSVVAFLEEHDINDRITRDAYRMYVAFSEEHGLNAVGNTEFGRRASSSGYVVKQVRRDGKRVRIYER